MNIESILEMLQQHTFGFASEEDLAEGIAQVLDAAEVAHAREVRLTQHCRIDMLTDEGIGIEVKCKGAWPEVLRQCERYAYSGQLNGLVLATTRHVHARTAGLTYPIPFVVCLLRSRAFA